jgi:hypothetical protein
MPLGVRLSLPSQSRPKCDAYASPHEAATSATGSRRHHANPAAAKLTSRTAPRLCVGPRWTANKISRSGTTASATQTIASAHWCLRDNRGERAPRKNATNQVRESPIRPCPTELGMSQDSPCGRSIRIADPAQPSWQGESLLRYNLLILSIILDIRIPFSLDFVAVHS